MVNLHSFQLSALLLCLVLLLASFVQLLTPDHARHLACSHSVYALQFGGGFPGGFGGGDGGGRSRKDVYTTGFYKTLGVEKNATVQEVNP